MEIVWDEPKRKANLAKHGLDFADFATCFDFDTALERVANPSRSGRSRLMLIGRWNDRLVVAAAISPLARRPWR